MSQSTPGVRPAIPHFSSGPCAKRPGWSLQALTDAVLGRSHRAKIGKAKLKRAIDLTREVLRSPGRLPHRHRAGLRHRRGRDGAVVAARRRGRSTMLAWESFGEGWVTDVAKQLKLKDVTHPQGAATASCPISSKVDSDDRRGLHLERHHLGRARAERRLDRRPTAQGLTICDATSAAFAQRARLRQARCRHLLLAEGARRRGRARHADPVAARGRAARELHAALAAAEDLPPDQGRQADRGHLRGRDHQHAVDAVRRGLSRHAATGRSRSAASRR